MHVARMCVCVAAHIPILHTRRNLCVLALFRRNEKINSMRCNWNRKCCNERGELSTDEMRKNTHEQWMLSIYCYPAPIRISINRAPRDCVYECNILFDFRHLQTLWVTAVTSLPNLQLHSHRFEHRKREFPSKHSRNNRKSIPKNVSV